MPDEVILDVTTIEENVTVETTAGDVVEIQVVAPTGTAATVAAGTTTTGAAGTNASVTNSGTTSAAVFNFTIPRGDTGETGATGATGAAGPNSVTSATTSDGTADLDVASLRVYPSGSITLVSTNSGGFVQLSGQAATDARSIAFPNASGTVALTSDITNAVTSETTSDGTASLDISNLTLSQDVTSGLQTAMTLSGNPTTVGDGQQIIWQWYNGGSPVTTAVIATEVTSSNSDKLIFKTSESGSLATSLDLNNSLATFSGVVSSLGATYQTGSTFTYNGASAAAHRTALGVSASGDTVLKSAYTPAHSLLVQQSGTGSPSSLSVGNNTILGRASGGGSEIAALSGSDARTVLGLSTLATTTPAVNVATFLETPTSANLAAAVTGETGTGALVFGTSPTIDAPTISGSAAFTSATRPTSAGTGTPAATSLITRNDVDARSVSTILGTAFTVNNSATRADTDMVLSLGVGTWELNGFFQTLNAATGGAKIYIAVVGVQPESYQHRLTMISVNSGSSNSIFGGSTPAYGSGTTPFVFSRSVASGAGSTFQLLPSVIVLTAPATFTIGFSQDTAVASDTILYAFSRFWANRISH